jgi:TonB family protein
MDGRLTVRYWRAPLVRILTTLFLVWFAIAAPAAQDVNQRLRESAAAGDIEAIRALLTSTDQITVDAADALGWTALMHAAVAGNDVGVQLLLDAGGNPDLQNAARDTALHLATQRGRTRVVQRLLEAGADFEARDDGGRTPLFMAIEGRHAEIIGLLHGAARAGNRRRSPALTLTVENETVAPVIIQWTDPPYAEESLLRKIEGTVVLMTIVRKDGSVGAVSVTKSLEAPLDQNAVQAVKTWKFDPATRAGVPVDVVVAIGVDFRLPEAP